jgi:hypothetical protein
MQSEAMNFCWLCHWIAVTWHKISRGAMMRTSIELTHGGRRLTVRASITTGEWYVWVYENGNRVYLYAVLGHDQGDQIDAALDRARRDIESGTVVLPTLRLSPRLPLQESDFYRAMLAGRALEGPALPPPEDLAERRGRR